jgi:hypothetical protein
MGGGELYTKLLDCTFDLFSLKFWTIIITPLYSISRVLQFVLQLELGPAVSNLYLNIDPSRAGTVYAASSRAGSRPPKFLFFFPSHASDSEEFSSHHTCQISLKSSFNRRSFFSTGETFRSFQVYNQGCWSQTKSLTTQALREVLFDDS